MLRAIAVVCAGVACFSPKEELKQVDYSQEVIPKKQIVYMNQPIDGEVIHFDATESKDDNEQAQK